jgi:hypothetical protein
MAKFERDIVIANDDGKVYRITQDVLSTLPEVDLKNNKFELIRGLLEEGVSAAAIPTRLKGGVEPDAFCYLLNLSSLKKWQPYEGT